MIFGFITFELPVYRKTVNKFYNWYRPVPGSSTVVLRTSSSAARTGVHTSTGTSTSTSQYQVNHSQISTGTPLRLE